MRLTSPRYRRKHRRDAGFALLETLVALAVLAIGLGTLAIGLATALRSDARLHARRTLDLIAQSRLEAAGRIGPMKRGTREGRTGRYLWRETVTPVVLGARSPDGAASAKVVVQPVWVEITVRSDDGIQTRLAALKLADGAPR